MRLVSFLTDWWVDILGLGLIGLWIACSAYTALVGDADLFQRLGSAGVAAAIIYFSLVRHAPETPLGLNERLTIGAKQQFLNADAALQALDNVGILAANWVQRDEQEKRGTPSSIKIMADAFLRSAESRPLRATLEERNAFLDQTERNLRDATEDVERQRQISEVFQSIAVVAATLQWGFGDCMLEASRCSS